MNNDAERLLEAWGAWARRGSGPVGWPQDTALGRRVAGQPGGQGWDAGAGFDIDSRAMQVDRLVSLLPRELRRLLVLHYAEPGEPEDKAAGLGMTSEVYEQQLEHAREAFNILR